jgi:hypothetical protein
MVQQYKGQEWCNSKNIDLKGSGYVTIGITDGILVLCNVYLETCDSYGGIVYRPIKFKELNHATEI